MEAKAKECIEVLPECYYPWFAQSMVMKRYRINISPFLFLWFLWIYRIIIICLSWQGKHWTKFSWFVFEVLCQSELKILKQRSTEGYIWELQGWVELLTRNLYLFWSCGNSSVDTYSSYLFQILLRSDLIKSSSEERSLLKNLGSWLGKFTIGRNQALLAKEIDPKVLIVEVLLF